MDGHPQILPDRWNPRTRRMEATTLPRAVSLPRRPVGRKLPPPGAAERRKERDVVMVKCVRLGLDAGEICALTGLSAKQVLRRLRVMILAAKAIRRLQDDDAAAVLATVAG